MSRHDFCNKGCYMSYSTYCDCWLFINHSIYALTLWSWIDVQHFRILLAFFVICQRATIDSDNRIRANFCMWTSNHLTSHQTRRTRHQIFRTQEVFRIRVENIFKTIKMSISLHKLNLRLPWPGWLRTYTNIFPATGEITSKWNMRECQEHWMKTELTSLQPEMQTNAHWRKE